MIRTNDGIQAPKRLGVTVARDVSSINVGGSSGSIGGASFDNPLCVLTGDV